MPSILFIMKYPLHRRDNLQAKFDGQLAAARLLGWEASFIGWDDAGLWLVGANGRERIRRAPLSRLPGYGHTLLFPALMAAAHTAIRRLRPDVVYLRYMPTFPGAARPLRTLKRQGGKLVLEFPTYPREAENSRFFWRRQVFRLTDRVLARIHPMVDLYTLIGQPCPGGQLLGRPAVNIVNGVDVDAYPLHVPNPQDATVRLLALASMSGWHGYDRLLTSLAAYRGDADVRLEFVGGDGDGSLAAWKALAETLGLSARVTFRGPLHGAALDSVVAACDVGVGSLGMYRYGLTTGMTLKLREYMARGLPFLTAVGDPALPSDPGFSLAVPNDDTPIDMAAVVAFAQNAKQDAAVSARMRAYARERMSWAGVLRGVLERVCP